jgi:hypothetical protein
MGFEITLKDVYDEQRAQAGRIDILSQQVAVHTATVATRLDSGQRKLDELDARVKALEVFRWKAAGFAAAIAVLASAAGALLDWLAAHH